MAINFPDNPTVGQTFTAANRTWTYNGSAWTGDYSSTGNADTIDGIDSSQFLRSDTSDTMNGALTITSDLTIADRIVHSGDTNTQIRFPAADTVSVETNGAERIRVNSAGDLLVGGTGLNIYSQTSGNGQFEYGRDTGTVRGSLMLSNNAARGWSTVYINKFNRPTGSDRRYIDWYLNGSTIAKIYVNAAGNGVEYETSTGTGLFGLGSSTVGLITNSTERLRVTSTGNVGIGTTSPDERLTIGSGSGISIRTTSQGTFGALKFGTSNSAFLDAWAGIDSDWEGVGQNVSNLRFYTSFGTRAERMRITSSGNVGIGVTNPTTKLQVNGTITATSYAGDGSNLTGISAGATGGGADQVFYENDVIVNSNYTITAGKNAMTAGPVEIADGVIITVLDGSAWTIV